MGRQTLPAPGTKVVQGALDVARVTMGEICSWLTRASAGKKSVAIGTLNNYRDGRREMPAPMRRLLAKELRKHARRVEQAADELDRTADD